MTNLEIAALLRKIAAAYLILDENRFKIIAYEKAADNIEQLTGQVKDAWKDGKLSDINGVGKTIAQHLDELFRTGNVKHFNDILEKLPGTVFPLLLIPGIGPKKAYRLVTELGLKSEQTLIHDLEDAARTHLIARMEGFGEKSEADILANIDTFKKGQIKENRILISEADKIAEEIRVYISKVPGIKKFDTLGSLRRRVATIGDIDIAVATENPEAVIDTFITFPHQKIIERGPTGASLLLNNGRQVDLRVQKPAAYGAMLQYFTGSKKHNITLRSYALEKGLSLNEYGIKNVKTKKIQEFATEEEFYRAVGVPWIPPELREDRGEIVAASEQNIPDLISLSDIRGDLHIHSNYDLSSSHDIGANDIEEYLTEAKKLGYGYIGFSDHNPGVSGHTQSEIIDIMKRRKDIYEHKYNSWVQKVYTSVKPANRVQMFLMCEVDILSDGSLALPEKAFEYLDAVIVSVHGSFQKDRHSMTKRVVRALEYHPKVRIFGHPTARLLGKRDGVDYDWDEIFDICKKRDIALEINAHPERLDLPDSIVFDARKNGVRFCIHTDSHAVDQMTLMTYGLSVARRGWLKKDDVLNSMGYTMFKEWLIK